MRTVGLWLMGICVAGCGGLEASAESPGEERAPLVDAAPTPALAPRDDELAHDPGPTMQLGHEHAVEPPMDLAQARRAYEELQPDSPHADEIVFDYAALSLKAGEKAQGQDAMLRLIREYPTSALVPNVYATFGDYMFDVENYEDANRLYEKLVSFQDPDVVAYGLYRMAWCRLRTNDEQDALELFVRSVRAVDEPSGWASALQSEAVAGAALAYAVVGQPDRAGPFFSKLARDAGVPATEPLRVLADAYDDAGDRQARDEVCTGLPDGC